MTLDEALRLVRKVKELDGKEPSKYAETKDGVYFVMEPTDPIKRDHPTFENKLFIVNNHGVVAPINPIQANVNASDFKPIKRRITV